MKIKTTLLAVLTLVSVTAFAQRQPNAVIPFSQDIQQIIINPIDGHVIVKESDAITSENPETKTAKWTIKKDDIVKVGAIEKTQKVLDALSSVGGLASSFQSSDAVELIPYSPYIRASIEKRDIIINSTNGEVVFNSDSRDYRVMESQFLHEIDKFLLFVSDGKKISYVLWNLQSGTEDWKTDLGEVAGFMSMLKSMFKSNPPKDKTVVSSDALYATLKGTLYKLNLSNGDVIWKSKDKISDFYPTQSWNHLIILKKPSGLLATKQDLNVWKTSDGLSIWKDDISTKRVVYLEDWSDRMLLAHAGGFNFYYYKDGKNVWKKDAKGSDIKQVISIDNDYLYIADKDMNLVDNNGQNLWKKTIEISDKSDDIVYYLGKVENNRVFYLTTTYGNMVDYASGKKIWKKNIEFDKDRPLLYAQDDNTKAFLVYNDKKIYKFDPNAVEKPEPIAKLKEVKDDKTMSSIELFDWGICLTGQSEVIGVNFDGTTRYHNTYKEPGGAGRKLLNVGKGVFSFGAKVAGSISQAKLEFYSVNEKGERVSGGQANLFNKDVQAVGGIIGETGSLLKKSKRFNALKQQAGYAFVLNKGLNGPELIKVKKETGEEVDKIELDNNKPLYEVDPEDGTIYYVYKNELRIFN